MDNIQHSRKKKAYQEYMGQTLTMNNGIEATIIEYRNYKDIDIQFHDKEKTIVSHVHCSAFQKGEIAHPDITSTQAHKHKQKYMDTEVIANNGQKMKVIRYGAYNDIDVQFEDGTIVKNKRYSEFKKGSILNPNYQINHTVSKNEAICAYYLEQIGFQKAAKNSLPELHGLELDLFHPNFNGYKIAIEYDGYWNRENNSHLVERDLYKNKLCEENDIILFRIREPQLPILDSTSTDLFLEDRTPMSKDLEHILQVLIAHLEVISKQKLDITINFDRDVNQINDFLSKYHNKHEQKRLQETRIMNNCMKATIIAYRAYNDIDVQFEDKTVVYHKTYHQFLVGKIKHPKIVTSVNKAANKYIGQTKKQNNGHIATIIDYRNYKDIDVQYEDQSIKTNQRCCRFFEGTLTYTPPILNTDLEDERVI